MWSLLDQNMNICVKIIEDLKMNPVFAITNKITTDLTRIERARGFIEAAALSDDWIAEMGCRALILEAHHTTHIEGTRLTLEQAGNLIEGKTVPDADLDDVKELLNYRDAFDFVSSYVAEGGPITEGLIREIHKRLVKHVRGGTAQPGEYRLVQNFVVNGATGAVVYTPPTPQDVPAMMAELVTWLGKETDIHPVIVSGIAQFQLVHIHPFIDGNGRTSRLLSTLCLYRAGYDFKKLFSISEYYDRDRARFYAAIQGVRDNGMDLSGWLEYFVEGLASQLVEVRKKGEKAIRWDSLVLRHGLSDRQAKILDLFVKQGILTIRDILRHYPEWKRRTVQRDLRAMNELGLIASRGATNNVEYELAE